MGGKESRPLCPKCKKPREEWRELPSVEKDFEEGSKTSNKTTDVKERKADTLCADCLVTQLERKDPVRGQNELEQDLKGALEVAKGICAMDRRKEAEKCQSSEVNKEVFHEEAGSNPGDKLRRESIPFPADETDASNQQALCETFKRLMRQDRFVAADVLNQVRELIIAKLSKTAAGETSEASGTVGTTDLKPIVQRLSYILGTETKRQHLLTIALNDTWSCMLNVEILERCSKLKFLELLLHFLDELRKNEADGTWVEVQRECLRCVLGEMGLDFTVASPLLSLTGQGHWSGQQALNLFNILTKCGGEHTDHRKTVEFLELLQKHNLPSTWTNPQGLSVMDMINQTSELKALHQRLKKQLVSVEWEELYCNLDIKYCTDTMSTQISPKDKMVLFGDLEGFVNNFLQRQPWVEKGEEKGVVFMPQSFVLGGHLPEDTIKFGHLGKEDTHIQSTLMTLVKAASTSMKHQTKMMVSWCLLVLSESGRLLQLGTGEGKSCVVAMFAAYRARWSGNKVDVLSSSPVLAKRDSDEWCPFYNDLNISVDCNTEKKNDESRKSCYNAQVVYGTVESFAADCLRQEFEKKDVRPERQFQCIIVDEVDSLLLDHGVQTTYLSSDMPAMEHLNIILATIWSMIKQFKFIPNSEPPTVQGPPLCFYKVLYENTDLSDDLLKGLLEKGEKDAILPPGFCASPDAMLDKCENLTEDSLIAFFSMASNVLGSTEMSGNLSYYTRDSNGQLKLCKGSNENMLSFLLCDKGQCSALYDVHMLCQDVEQAVRSNLHFSNVDKSHKKVPQEILFIQNTLKKISMKLLNKKSTDPNATANTIDTRTHIPGFLKNLVDQKLGMWVQNAFQALQMQEKERYIVCPDGICPVDSEHTGVVERNKKWGDGLQQFLEMKHRIKLNSMTVITNFLSNVSFFKKYQGKIYGTTGTIGNKYEITSLTELYNGLSTVKIPSFLNSKLFEEAGEMLGDEHQWTEKICTAVLQQTRRTRYRDGRAALVICETIKQAQNIFRALDKRQQQQTNEIRNLKIYTDDRKDNTNVTGQELRPGDVIVATNLAGRGTDIVVSKEVLTAGGLFVVLTFLPANDRVEQQAFGRTARQGRPGSAQLLACSTHLPSRVYDLLRTSESPGPLLLQEARDARDHVSAKRVKQVLKNDIPRILQREELFEEYCGILEEDVYKKNTEKGNRKVLVAILNEYWGLWYLRRSDELRENNLEQLKGELRTDMKNKLTKNSQCSSMYHYIKFGNKLMFEKKYEESIKLYTKAIELDKEWAAIAYYYCAYAQYKTYCQRGITQDFISNLEKACESVDLYISQYQTILCLLCGKENDESQPDRSMGLELHGAVMQTASREEEAEEKTEEEQRQENSSLHEQITAKIHLWVFFRQNIEAVIKENSKTMKKCTVFSLMKSPSTVEQREMFRLHQMGLEMVFGTSDMLRFCWQGMVVISLGVVELFGSLLLGDMGLALVSSLGAGENSLGILGTQGARDIMVGIRAMKTGDVNWNILMRDKAASFINQFLVLGLFQNQVRKVFKLPDAEQVGMLQMLTNAKTILVSKMNNLSVSPRRNLDHVSKLICEYGLKMEDQVNLKEICDSVSESILAKSLEIMAKRIESDPLISLINNLVRHYEPIEDNTVTSCYSVLPKYQTDLEKIFMVLVKRAAESQFTGKKRPKTLVELTESVGRRVVAQLQEGKKEEIGITGIMKQEYEAEFQRSAPQALLDTADEYIKVLCELLEKYSKELGARKGRSAPSSEQLGFFRKKLVKPAASELSQALWEMLLQFLGHQQADLFSSRLRRDLGLTSQSFSKADGRKRAGLKTGVGNIHKKYIQRQRTLRVINQLKDFTE
ncbi:hypothetical protein DPEC_G00176810 [Dallia pectoralis]|uniref:Uncharacterized protein n=1 Tax=Dallia pectoralis TaxID=75939 RepID=A0ACC2GEX1_DALPE|nr:hypothetical protein DPEC_G00176810 [Dallia pectoralis]